LSECCPKALTVTEMANLLDMEPSTDHSPAAEFLRSRDHAILELAYASGLRVSEITSAHA
jgi:site-specific recombinase XerD